MTMQNILGKSILYSTPLLLIGCGGNAVINEGNQLTIDKYNAKTIAAKVLQAQSIMNDAGIITGEGFTNLRNHRNRTTYYDEYQCYYGGSASIVFGDHDEDLYLSSGDDFTIDYQQCGISDEDFQGDIDGKISLHLYEVYEDTYSDILDYDVSYVNTYLTSQTNTIALNGAMQVYYYDDKSNEDLYLKFYAMELIVDTTYERTALKETTLDFFSNLSTEYYAYTFDGTLYSEDGINGTVYFTTTILFEGYGDAYPDTGRLMIRGDKNANLTLEVIDAAHIDLLLDSNDDGYPEEVIHTTWKELL